MKEIAVEMARRSPGLVVVRGKLTELEVYLN